MAKSVKHMAATAEQPSLLEMIMPEPKHKWLIHMDTRATFTAPSMGDNMVGVSGPHGMCGLPIPLPDKFRLLDGEGWTLYEGTTNAGALATEKGSNHTGLEPLEEFGRTRGAQFIEYLINGRWLRPRGRSAGKRV
jgi:hypothetical protein